MGSTWTPSDWTWNVNDRRFKWAQRFALSPKRSCESGQRIWLKNAWYGYRWIDGPAGEPPLKDERWLTEEEYIWYQLTSE